VPLDPPDGFDGFGTVNVPVTLLYVPLAELKTAPAQFVDVEDDSVMRFSTRLIGLPWR
jgi:hypothetical protein